jgi:fucose permease
MLLTDMAGCMGSLIILLVLDYLKSHAALWVITFAVGLFMASIYATAFSLPGEFGINVNSRAASIMVVVCSIGNMGLPVVAGWTMSWFEPQALFWTILVIYCMAILTYVGIVYSAYLINKSKKDLTEQEFELVQTKE